MPDPQDEKKHKLVHVNDVGVIAFPGHFDDSKIIAAIRGHKDSSKNQQRSYTTKLNPDEESAFQTWANHYKVPWQDTPTADYDMRGYWKAQVNGDPAATAQQQYPDKWKTPYHKTYSDKSIFATMAIPDPKGLVEPGNIPIWHRPVVKNADGTHSTEFSTSFTDDQGHEVLVPTVVDGKFLTPDGTKPPVGSSEEKAMFAEAWKHYEKTGENLGKFDSAANADAYSGILHNRGVSPTGPVTTEQSEHARQLAPAKPLSTVIDPIDRFLAPSEKPGPTTDLKSAAAAAAYVPKEAVKGGVAMTVSPVLHPLDTVKALWEQARQFMPAYANTSLGISIPVPNQETLPAAMAQKEQFEKYPEYTVGSFVLPAVFGHLMGAKPVTEPVPRANTSVIAANPMGEVRVGTDNVPSVWLSPKGWENWIKAFKSDEDPTKIPGMSIRADQAAEKMFSSKMNASPEWLDVQKLLGKAHESANGGNAMNMMRTTPSKVAVAFRVLPEEQVHSWQRMFSQNGFLQEHLPEQAWQRTAAKVPEQMKTHLAAEKYDVSNPHEVVIETAAKFTVGDLQGTDPAQAAEFLDHYFKEVTDAHGPQALNKLEQARQATIQMQKEILDEHQQAQRGGSQAGVPSVETRRSTGAGAVAPQQAADAAAYQRDDINAFKREAEYNNPDNWILQGARDFARKEGRDVQHLPASSVDFRNKDIADAYDAMKHNPNDPKVKAAYDAMKSDVNKQWDYATQQMGIKFEPSKTNPYANSAEMVKDVKDNHRLKFYQGGDMPADHPLAAVDPETGLTYNDKLRAIHDLFGHAMEGFQFGPKGEENAWIAHSQMFSPEALPAVTTETKGQNSWVNSGPHLRDAQGNVLQPGLPGYVAPDKRPFAEQKAGLLPQRFHYRTDAPISFISPNTLNLSLSEAQQKLSSAIQKRFSGMARDLASAIGVRPSVRPVIGSWQGGAENSVIHQFPVGTDPDAVRYYNAILGKLGYQNSTGAFFPGEGSDHLYAFWTGSNDTSEVAKTLLDHGLENSTIEPVEGGHSVYLVGRGDEFRGKVDRATDAIGVKGHVEQYAGTAEFPGNYDSRDAAARDFSSTAEALESKHPEWRQIRQGFESRPDTISLHKLIESTREIAEPEIDVVHYSNAPDIERLDPSRYGENKTHDVSGSVVDRPDLRRKESFPNYWNPETYVGEESSQQFHNRAAERFAARQFTYKGKVGAHSIYDMAADPDKIRDLSRKELGDRNFKRLGVRLLPSDAEVDAYAIKKLKDLGYSGRRDVNGLIASWEDIPVKNANISPAEDIQHYLANEDRAFKRESLRTWNEIRQHLTPEERARHNTPEKQQRLVDAVNMMPRWEEWDAAVKAGWSGRLWYERSSKAFDALVESQPDMFRKSDKEKFLNFVSALSPVQPVRANLLMAVNLWDKWNKAGRPVDVVWKDTKKLTGVANKNSSLYRILRGGRNTYGVDLPARLFNGIRALQDQPLSGPKVSAFAPNLGTDTMKSTNDTWMAIFGNTDPNQISQPHLYDAMSAMVREAGKKNGIPPRQAQAAIWSFIKSLAELSGWGKDRWIPPQEIIKQGLLTPELIDKHAADFADMLANDQEIRGRIKDIGGDLDALDKKLKKYVPTRSDKAGTAHVDPRLLNAAERLETARANARIQSHLEAKTEKPSLFDTSFEGNDLAFSRKSFEDLKKEAEERNPEPRPVYGNTPERRNVERQISDLQAKSAELAKDLEPLQARLDQHSRADVISNTDAYQHDLREVNNVKDKQRAVETMLNRLKGGSDNAFKRESENKTIKTDGWFTAAGKFIPNSKPGKHLETAIKHGLAPERGNTYKQAWAGGHIRVSQFDANKWGLQVGTNNADTQERLVQAIERLPDNAFSIVVEANYANDDAPKIWNSFSGPSAKIEAQDWVDSGMKKDYAGRDFAFKRKTSDDKSQQLPATSANLGAVSALLAEAKRRNPSKKENAVVTVP